MSRAEKSSWMSLAVSTIVLVYFIMKMTDSWRVLDHDTATLISIYLSVIVLAVMLFVAGTCILMVLERIAGSKNTVGETDIEMDERDHAIAARAQRHELIFVGFALNALIIHLLASNALPATEDHLFRLDTLADQVFVLFLIVGMATLVKEVSRLISYRR